MKFFFDARYMRTDFHDGISRYSSELGHAVAARIPVTFLICDPAQRALLPAHAETLLIHSPTSFKEPWTARILNAFEPDVVFSPMQTMGSVGKRFALILTVHDLIYYRHSLPPRALPLHVRAGWRLYHMSYVPQRLALRGADAVAVVSKTTRRDVLRTKMTTRPLVVVPNAPQDLGRFLSQPPNLTSRPTNLIYMGSFMPYKNVETLLDMMAHLPAEYTLHLVSRITSQRKTELRRLIPEGANVVFHGGVSDEAYASLLANQAVLVSASLDEGYGLPLAEALGLGVPAVVSNLPIFREVAGAGALYAAPRNAAQFAAQVQKTARRDVREALVKNGTQHIAQFNWGDSAETLIRAARKLLVQ